VVGHDVDDDAEAMGAKLVGHRAEPLLAAEFGPDPRMVGDVVPVP
jgi:hypothetical protein